MLELLESVDLNGLWGGWRGSRLYGVPLPLTVDHDPPINNGRFLYAGAKGVSIDGVFSAPGEVGGAINAPSCERTYWYAGKK